MTPTQKERFEKLFDEMIPEHRFYCSFFKKSEATAYKAGCLHMFKAIEAEQEARPKKLLAGF